MTNVRTSGVGGEQTKLANNAEMTTKGIELALRTRNFKNDNFSWTSEINFSYFDQKITKLRYESNVWGLVRELGGNVLGEQRNTLYSFDFQKLDDRGLPVLKLKEGQDPLETSTSKIDKIF